MRRLVFSYVTNLAAYGPVRLIAAVGMIIVCSLTEGVSIAFLIPVLQAAGLDLENQAATESIAKAVTLGFAVFGAQPTLPLLLMIFISIVGARSLLSRAQSVAIFAVEQHFVLALRQRLHQAITNADWLFLCRSRSTDFTHALTEEAARLGGATFVLLTLAADLTVSAVFVVLAFALSGIITVLVLGAGALLLVAHHQMVHKIHSAGNELSAALKAFYAATIDQMESLKAAKASSAQERSIALFSAAYTAISRHQAATGSWFEIGSTVALCLMLYIAVAVIRLPASAILTLLLIFWRLMPRLTSAHQHLRSFASVLPAFGTVIDMTKRCEEVAEPPQPTGPLLALTHTLRFEGVCFSYRTDAAGVRDIDLVIEQGTIVALVGPSGVGKSTVLDLAMGLLSPHSGRIVIDGMPLTLGNARGWRHQLGYVGPETTLFHLSVRNNLLWAQPKATDGEIFEALRLAAAEALVLSLPEGLDTLIGDRGVLLSQGECQRLALARALLRRPRFLILDEATNNLDVETETLVMQALRRERAELTVLLTAHRLATLRWADVIHVLEDGRLVESGQWDDLGEPSGPRFRALCEAQRTLIPAFATPEVVHRNRAHAALERVVHNVHCDYRARRPN
jgi:ATP-binding cassette subfamily C protein